MNTLTRLVSLVVFSAIVSPALSQGALDDYARARSYGARTGGRVFRTNVRPQWLPSGQRFWYRIQVARGKYEFVFVDARRAKRELAFDHTKLAEQLAKASGRVVLVHNLPFQRITFGADSRHVGFRCFGRQWTWDRQNHKLSPGKLASTKQKRSLSRGVELVDSFRRSIDKGGETSLRVDNKTNKPVTLIWIDRSGRPKSYGQIAAGKSKRQRTFAGHVWLVRDVRGRPLLAFVSSDQPGHAVVDGKSRPRGNWSRRQRRRRRARPKTTSPDGKWEAFIRNHNVFVRDAKSKQQERQLSRGGDESNTYQGAFYWSPDSRYLVVPRRTRGQRRQVYLIESSPRNQLQPKLHQMTYDKPGDTLSQSRPYLFDVRAGKERPIETRLFPNAWSPSWVNSEIRWAAHSKSFTFAYNQRGHQVLRIIEVAADSGKTRALVEEKSKTFIDYAYKRHVSYLDKTNELIWMSERDGWNHLYLYDTKQAKVKTQITKGRWVVRGVERVDVEKRQVWFRAAGIFAGQDPYYVHLCRVNFDGSGFVKLTRSDGTHRWSFSPTREYLLVTWSRVDHPPVTELRRVKDGTLVCRLETADWSDLLATGWRPPERFVAKGRDGKANIHGILVRPMNFDPKRKYPVIEKIYAGPHGSFVPKSFSRLNDHFSMAELGFMVVQIDGMGTSNRSKAFHDVCHKNIGDSGFPDRILWMKAAQKRYPQMDLSRVGIYGGSAGGQSALRALLAFGHFYKAAVSDCGCHDNRMDKVWWNELWMGWPIGSHYKEQSNVTQAHRLTGKLLLIVGELDRNVDPASTMQVVNALIKADKDFDLLLVPGGGHGVGGGRYGRRRRRDFFVRHLLKVEPRWKK